jgi:hypothetical protein
MKIIISLMLVTSLSFGVNVGFRADKRVITNINKVCLDGKVYFSVSGGGPQLVPKLIYVNNSNTTKIYHADCK